MSFIYAKMSFCYSIRLFMPDTVAKPYQYFIIIFVLNPLFIQFSLSCLSIAAVSLTGHHLFVYSRPLSLCMIFIFLKRVANLDNHGVADPSKVNNFDVADPSEVNNFGGWPWLVETKSLGKKCNGGVGCRHHHSKPSNHCANPGFSSIFLLLDCLL